MLMFVWRIILFFDAFCDCHEGSDIIEDSCDISEDTIEMNVMLHTLTCLTDTSPAPVVPPSSYLLLWCLLLLLLLAGGAALCMMRNLELERLELAAMSCGMARRALELMTA